MLLDQDFQFYKDNQEGLVKKYQGKFLIIHNEKVVEVYDAQLEAYTQGEKKYGLGNFLLQECLPGKDSYTQTFHSRVSFV